MGFSDGESIKRSALHQPHHHLFHGMHFPARDERAQHGSFLFTFSTCTIAFATVFRGPAYWHQRMNKRTKQNKTATDGRIINQQGHPSHTPKTIFLTRLTISHRLMWWGVSSTFVHMMLGGYQKSAWILRAGGRAGRTRSFFFSFRLAFSAGFVLSGLLRPRGGFQSSVKYILTYLYAAS